MPALTILVIDYDPRTLDLVRPSLEKAGYRVATARDGVSGVDAFNAIEPDLTLIEYMLPKLSGLEVCKALRNTPRGQHIPLVMMSSRFRSRLYRQEARRHHADDFLEKPFTEETLLAVVRNLLRRREAESPVLETVEVPVGAAENTDSPPAEQQPATDFEAEVADRLDSLLGDL